MKIRIFSEEKALEYLKSIRPEEAYVISIADPDREMASLNRNRTNSLHLSFYDMFDSTFPGGPKENHIHSLLEFGSQLEDSEKEIIIYCTKGISRSPAVAYTLMCWKWGYKNEERALEDLFNAKGGDILPNFLFIQLADRVMLRGGRMVNAIAKNFY